MVNEKTIITKCYLEAWLKGVKSGRKLARARQNAVLGEGNKKGASFFDLTGGIRARGEPAG